MVNFFNLLAAATSAASSAASTDSGKSQLGMLAFAAAFSVWTGMASSFGEAWICCHAIDGMTRNPEKHSMLNSTMILAVALDESCAIYALLVSILIIFVLGGKVS
ncbi:MAG: ATP synthase subunit c [Tenericutes bacterium ADurb.BinA155]|jgi:F-type H+-transporting ATPase subunit c|nr:MAG: ATP synthase subunit c [Tenericutes bacterium ADurb.BinA155]